MKTWIRRSLLAGAIATMLTSCSSDNKPDCTPTNKNVALLQMAAISAPTSKPKTAAPAVPVKPNGPSGNVVTTPKATAGSSPKVNASPKQPTRTMPRIKSQKHVKNFKYGGKTYANMILYISDDGDQFYVLPNGILLYVVHNGNALAEPVEVEPHETIEGELAEDLNENHELDDQAPATSSGC